MERCHRQPPSGAEGHPGACVVPPCLSAQPHHAQACPPWACCKQDTSPLPSSTLPDLPIHSVLLTQHGQIGERPFGQACLGLALGRPPYRARERSFLCAWMPVGQGSGLSGLCVYFPVLRRAIELGVLGDDILQSLELYPCLHLGGYEDTGACPLQAKRNENRSGRSLCTDSCRALAVRASGAAGPPECPLAAERIHRMGSCAPPVPWNTQPRAGVSADYAKMWMDV